MGQYFQEYTFDLNRERHADTDYASCGTSDLSAHLGHCELLFTTHWMWKENLVWLIPVILFNVGKSNLCCTVLTTNVYISCLI